VPTVFAVVSIYDVSVVLRVLGYCSPILIWILVTVDILDGIAQLKVIPTSLLYAAVTVMFVVVVDVVVE